MIKGRKDIKSCQLSQASLTNRILLLNFTFSDFTLHCTLCNKDQHFTWNLDFKVSICFWYILKAFLLLLIHHLCLLHIPSCSTSSQLCWCHRNTRNSACISLVICLCISSLGKEIRLWNFFFWRARVNITSHPSAEKSSISGFSLPSTLSVHVVSLASPSISQQSLYFP